MIHQYKSNGYNIVMDINSGAIHVVDDVVYDIIELYEGHEKSEIMDMLAPKYPKEDMEEAFEEIETLIKEESLFTEDIYKDRCRGRFRAWSAGRYRSAERFLCRQALR